MATIFVSYSRKDTEWVERLKPHFGVLQRRLANQEYPLEVWDDTGIHAGAEWRSKIFRAIDEAVVAVLLVSADALTSDFILREELPRLLERVEKEALILIPLILRPCDWQNEPQLSRFQSLPFGNRTLSELAPNEIERCILSLTDEIRAQFESIRRLPLPANPYKGLHTFEEHDKNVFFGREEITNQLIDGVRHSPLLCLVGSSGSGKSSLVYAGLVPRLRKDGWLIVLFRPRDNPVGALAEALAELLRSRPGLTRLPYDEADLADGLRNRIGFLVDFLSLVAQEAKKAGGVKYVAEAANNTGVLLFVDQFEEVFTNCSPEIRGQFLGALLHASRLEDPWAAAHLRYLWTLRFDFLEQAFHERETGLSDNQNTKLEFLRDMTDDQLRDVIERPAHWSGASFERGLVEIILRDVGVGNERGKLPLLEFCLEELWSGQAKLGGRVLSRQAYDNIGGFQGAVTQYAEAVFNACNAEEQAVAPTLFIHLVNVATSGDVGDTRRPFSRDELLRGDDDRRLFQTLVDKLVNKRLLVKGEAPGRQESVTIELAHEILIQAWKRLKTWVDENREFLKKLHQVETAMGSNQSISGPLLDECETWLRGSTRRLLPGAIIRFTESSLAEHARAQIRSLLDGKVAALRQYMNQLKYHSVLVPMLQERLASERNEEIRRRLSLALLRIEDEASDSVVDYLKDQLLIVEPAEFSLVCDALEPHRERLLRELWSVALAPDLAPGRRLRAACAVSRFDPESGKWFELVSAVAEQLANENPLYVPFWLDALQLPVRERLIAPLTRLCKNRLLPDVERAVATTILADCAADGTDVLVDVLLEVSAKPYGLLWPKVHAHRERAREILHAELLKELSTAKTPADRDLLARRQAQSAVALAQLGEIEPALRLLRHGAEPTRRTYVVHDLGPLGTPAEVAIRALESERDPGARRALVLALGEFSREQLPDPCREPLIVLLLQQYQDDADPGIHGAIDWLLGHRYQEPSPRKFDWGQSEGLVSIDGYLAKQPIGGRGWYVSREGLTFAVIQGPERFLMGSPEQEKDHRKDETLHRRRISRRFAIATKPVTVGQFEKFREDTNLPKDHQTWNYAPYKNCPQPRVTWFEAAAYCNWLSQREGISEEQWCYKPKNGHYVPGMTVAPNYLSLSGYRLPTETEWEYSCRAGSSASRYFGDSDELLTLYAWFNKNANDRTQLVGSLKPNDFGLFDMLGNVEEWCQDRFRDYPSIGAGEPIEDVEDQLDVLEGINADERVRRGGSFIIFAGLVRSADRDSDSPDDRRNYVGFRPARTCT